MAGTREGGLKAAASNKASYGLNFYGMIGRLGGLKSRGGGFQKGSDLPRTAGSKGGKNRWKSRD